MDFPLAIFRITYPRTIILQVLKILTAKITGGGGGACDFPDSINKYLIKETCHGAIMGPFKQNSFKDDIKLSPLKSIPKSEPTSRRVILNLSYPKSGDSVNSHILKDYYLGKTIDLFFPKIDDFVVLIQSKGKGSLMFKLDLRRAYRLASAPQTIIELASNGKIIFFYTVLTMSLHPRLNGSVVSVTDS